MSIIAIQLKQVLRNRRFFLLFSCQVFGMYL